MSSNHDVTQIQVAGWVTGRLKMERHLEEWIYQTQSGDITIDDGSKYWVERIRYGFETVRNIVGKIWLYVMLGIAVAVGIHRYVPEGAMTAFMGKSTWWSVPPAGSDRHSHVFQCIRDHS